MDIDFASSCNHYRMYCWLSFLTRITVASEDFQTTTLRPCRISFTRRSRSGRSAFTFWTKMLQMLRPGLTRSGSCPCRWNREFGICWLSKKAPASAIPTAFSARTLTLQFPTAAMLIRVPESGSIHRRGGAISRGWIFDSGTFRYALYGYVEWPAISGRNRPDLCAQCFVVPVLSTVLDRG